jgi:hypothetical protein
VVGLIGALVAEAAGSIAGRQLTGIGACRRKLISHLDPKPDFGVAESILKPATATQVRAQTAEGSQHDSLPKFLSLATLMTLASELDAICRPQSPPLLPTQNYE